MRGGALPFDGHVGVLVVRARRVAGHPRVLALAEPRPRRRNYGHVRFYNRAAENAGAGCVSRCGGSGRGVRGKSDSPARVRGVDVRQPEEGGGASQGRRQRRSCRFPACARVYGWLPAAGGGSWRVRPEASAYVVSVFFVLVFLDDWRRHACTLFFGAVQSVRSALSIIPSCLYDFSLTIAPPAGNRPRVCLLCMPNKCFSVCVPQAHACLLDRNASDDRSPPG